MHCALFSDECKLNSFTKSFILITQNSKSKEGRKERREEEREDD
jgi:hypothetical protein